MLSIASPKLSSRSVSVILLAVAALGVFAFLSVAAAQSECVKTLDGNGAVGGSWTDDCISESTPTGLTDPPAGTRYARFYSFAVSERSDVTITLETETDPYIFLLDGDGDVVAENDDIDTTGGNYNSQIRETLAAGGYTVEATTYSREATGEFTLTLSGLPAAVEAQSTATQTPSVSECESTLTAETTGGSWTDECSSRNREDAYARFYSFTLVERSDVTVTLESATDPYLYLLDGDGDAVAENDDIDTDGGNLNSQIQETLDEGDYTIEATTYSAEATGEFTLIAAGIDFAASAPTPEPTSTTAPATATAVPTPQPTATPTPTPIPPTPTPTPPAPSIRQQTTSTPVPTATPEPAPCSNGTVIPVGISNSGLRADCELLWALKKGWTNSDERLNWDAKTDIRNWNGLTGDNIGGSPLRVLALDLGRTTEVDYHLEGGISLPADLVDDGGLSELTDLDLRGNRLSGSIPTELGSLSNLKQLSLLGNDLTGSIPTELGSLSSLEYLDLSWNHLTGSIPSELGKLSNLTYLYLSDNDLTGPIPSELGRLSNLRVLYVAFNDLSGCIPNGLRGVLHNDLFELGISYCIVPTPTPTPVPAPVPTPAPHSGDRAALVALYNSAGGANWTRKDNWLSDRPFDEWYGVRTYYNDGRVRELFFSNKNLSGSIPAALGNLSNLEYLYLGSNELTGSIPAALGNLSNLKYLNLKANELTGSIPAALGKLSKLEYLNLYHNQLSGPIPAELGRLSKLKWHLDLSWNNLNGSIPKELGNLSKLGLLRLDRNQLSGSIPKELGNMSDLKGLLLSRNELTGSIPSELGNLSKLTSLYLSNNRLIGCIPEGLRDVRSNDFAATGKAFCE